MNLCEGEAGLAVNLEDLLDGVDVRCRPQVQTQVVLVRCSHDLLHEEEEGCREGGRTEGTRGQKRKQRDTLILTTVQ